MLLGFGYLYKFVMFYFLFLFLFFLNEILQMLKFKFFVSRNKLSTIPEIFLKFANVKHN